MCILFSLPSKVKDTGIFGLFTKLNQEKIYTNLQLTAFLFVNRLLCRGFSRYPVFFIFDQILATSGVFTRNDLTFSYLDNYWPIGFQTAGNPYAISLQPTFVKLKKQPAAILQPKKGNDNPWTQNKYAEKKRTSLLLGTYLFVSH